MGGFILGPERAVFLKTEFMKKLRDDHQALGVLHKFVSSLVGESQPTGLLVFTPNQTSYRKTIGFSVWLIWDGVTKELYDRYEMYPVGDHKILAEATSQEPEFSGPPYYLFTLEVTNGQVARVVKCYEHDVWRNSFSRYQRLPTTQPVWQRVIEQDRSPIQQLKDKQAAMSDAELIERISEALPKWCKGEGWQMSVPPQVGDSDMLVGELLRRYKQRIQPVCHPRRIAWLGDEIEKGVCLDCGAKVSEVCRKPRK